MPLEHSRNAKVIVELGCYEGRTTAALAKNTSGTVFSIDPFSKGRLGICYGERISKINAERNRLKNVTFLKGLSYEVAPTFSESVDFMFINADHTYEAVKKDWEDSQSSERRNHSNA